MVLRHVACRLRIHRSPLQCNDGANRTFDVAKNLSNKIIRRTSLRAHNDPFSYRIAYSVGGLYVLLHACIIPDASICACHKDAAMAHQQRFVQALDYLVRFCSQSRICIALSCSAPKYMGEYVLAGLLHASPAPATIAPARST